MTVYTNILRHLNARWITDITSQNKVYCGVSKNAIQLFNEEQTQDALNSCNVFAKVNSTFIKEKTQDSLSSVFLLTKQKYYKQDYIVNKHSFLDNKCEWDIIDPNNAMHNFVYTTDTYFTLNTQYDSYESELENLKSFYFFFNLKINGITPDSEQIVRHQNDVITADYIIVKDRIGCANNAINGNCDNIINSITMPKGIRERFHYFISF